MGGCLPICSTRWRKAGHLRHVSLLQGTKAYGGHHHAVALPCRERQPRDEHANFYWLQEDYLRAAGGEAGFAFTVFRPQVLLGGAAGVAMNPVAALGAYAASPANWGCPLPFLAMRRMWEMVDTGLLAEAFAWAAVATCSGGPDLQHHQWRCAGAGA